MRTAIRALLALVLVLPAVAASASDENQIFTRKQVTGIIAEFRKLVSPNSVEEQLEIPIGGTKQWILVRGRDRANPILLVIHGGPASPEMPIGWAYQSGWEDYFTVVQWDQRGSGKTYNANDPTQIRRTLSLDRIVEDSREVIAYLCKRYGKQKVFVLGHSWGSLVGLTLAQKHPELLYAYVGVGQVIDGVAAERAGYTWTLAEAEKRGNAQAMMALKAIAPYPEKSGAVPLAKINIERTWNMMLGGLTWGRSGLDYYYDVAKLSPDYTVADLGAIDKGSALSLSPLLPDFTRANFANVTEFKTPIVLFLGRHDYTTASSVAAEWLAHVKAPGKKIVWFENSAHMMPVEEPGRFLVHLVEDVRPLASIVMAPRRPIGR